MEKEKGACGAKCVLQATEETLQTKWDQENDEVEDAVSSVVSPSMSFGKLRRC